MNPMPYEIVLGLLIADKKARPSCWSGTNCDPFSLASAS